MDAGEDVQKMMKEGSTVSVTNCRLSSSAGLVHVSTTKLSIVHVRRAVQPSALYAARAITRLSSLRSSVIGDECDVCALVFARFGAR